MVMTFTAASAQPLQTLCSVHSISASGGCSTSQFQCAGFMSITTPISNSWATLTYNSVYTVSPINLPGYCSTLLNVVVDSHNVSINAQLHHPLRILTVWGLYNVWGALCRITLQFFCCDQHGILHLVDCCQFHPLTFASECLQFHIFLFGNQRDIAVSCPNS